MRKVWKYELFEMTPSMESDRKTVEMPMGAQIVGCGMQGTTLCIWAYIDTDPGTAPRIPRTFRVVGTGHPVADRATTTADGTPLPRYVGIAFHEPGLGLPSFVWHVVEDND